MTTALGQVAGNEHVVKLLSRSLERAQEGDINYAVVILCSVLEASRKYAGATEMRQVARHVIDNVRSELDAIIHNDVPPPQDPTVGADYWMYNLPAGPANFDFIHWLIDVEMTRVRAGAPAPLKVAFWRGINGQSGMKTQTRRVMFENVLRPALALVGAVEDERALAGQRKHSYVAREIVNACRRGETVPKFKTLPQLAMPWRGAITITLREASHLSHRNSRIAEWLKVADKLTAMGEEVVFVRDTAMADEPLRGHRTFPAASKDLLTRVAFYQQAKANLFIGNGPAALATFIDAPCLIMCPMEEDSDAEISYGTIQNPFVWEHLFGQPVGEQLPWCAPDQRIEWQEDTADNILSAYHQWVRPKEKAVA